MTYPLLTKTGLTYFWQKVKSYIDGKLPTITSSSDEGKVLVVQNGQYTLVSLDSLLGLQNGEVLLKTTITQQD